MENKRGPYYRARTPPPTFFPVRGGEKKKILKKIADGGEVERRAVNKCRAGSRRGEMECYGIYCAIDGRGGSVR
jgi:hypothetical protein